MRQSAARVYPVRGHSSMVSINASGQFFLSSRSPKRVTMTIPHFVYERMIKRSNLEGRSVSNLAAYLVERALDCVGDGQ